MANKTLSVTIQAQLDAGQAQQQINALKQQLGASLSQAGGSANAQPFTSIGKSAQDAGAKVATLGSSFREVYRASSALRGISGIFDQLKLPGAESIRLIGDAVQGLGPAFGVAGAAAVGFGTVIAGQLRAGVEAAAQFETSLARINALTSNTVAQTAALGQTATQLSTGRNTAGAGSANELARAGYFIASSGFSGTGGRDVLKASALASAGGLGDVAKVADVVTSALNAYQLPATRATEITDKFIAIVREGKAEPEQLAKSIGQVLPISAAAGISLDQVGAAIATITRTGSSTPQAVTSLRQAISALIDPSKEAITQLREIGLSALDVRENLRSVGLKETIADIFQRTGGDEGQLSNIFGNIRALTGVLSLGRGELKDYDTILQSIKASSGETVRAAEIMGDTYEAAGQRATNAWENFKRSIATPLVGPATNLLQSASTSIRGLTESNLQGQDRQIADIVRQLSDERARGAASAATGANVFKTYKPISAEDFVGKISDQSLAGLNKEDVKDLLAKAQGDLLRLDVNKGTYEEIAQSLLTRMDKLEKDKQKTDEALTRQTNDRKAYQSQLGNDPQETRQRRDNYAIDSLRELRDLTVDLADKEKTYGDLIAKRNDNILQTFNTTLNGAQQTGAQFDKLFEDYGKARNKVLTLEDLANDVVTVNPASTSLKQEAKDIAAARRLERLIEKGDRSIEKGQRSLAKAQRGSKKGVVDPDAVLNAQGTIIDRQEAQAEREGRLAEIRSKYGVGAGETFDAGGIQRIAKRRGLSRKEQADLARATQDVEGFGDAVNSQFFDQGQALLTTFLQNSSQNSELFQQNMEKATSAFEDFSAVGSQFQSQGFTLGLGFEALKKEAQDPTADIEKIFGKLDKLKEAQLGLADQLSGAAPITIEQAVEFKLVPTADTLTRLPQEARKISGEIADATSGEIGQGAALKKSQADAFAGVQALDATGLQKKLLESLGIDTGKGLQAVVDVSLKAGDKTAFDIDAAKTAVDDGIKEIQKMAEKIETKTGIKMDTASIDTSDLTGSIDKAISDIQAAASGRTINVQANVVVSGSTTTTVTTTASAPSGAGAVVTGAGGGTINKVVTKPKLPSDKERASGGPVSTKDYYLVGEKGPELFVPSADGAILPSRDTSVIFQYLLSVIRGKSLVNCPSCGSKGGGGGGGGGGYSAGVGDALAAITGRDDTDAHDRGVSRDRLRELARNANPNSTGIDDAHDRGKFADALRKLEQKGGSIPLTSDDAFDRGRFRDLPHRQGGGRVTKGGYYVIGENGRELFVPTVDGTIVPQQTIPLPPGTIFPQPPGSGGSILPPPGTGMPGPGDIGPIYPKPKTPTPIIGVPTQGQLGTVTPVTGGPFATPVPSPVNNPGAITGGISNYLNTLGYGSSILGNHDLDSYASVGVTGGVVSQDVYGQPVASASTTAAIARALAKPVTRGGLARRDTTGIADASKKLPGTLGEGTDLPQLAIPQQTGGFGELMSSVKTGNGTSYVVNQVDNRQQVITASVGTASRFAQTASKATKGFMSQQSYIQQRDALRGKGIVP